MAERDRSAPSKLLEDLESIRNLLDEETDSPASSPGQVDIPLLQDVIRDEPARAEGPVNPFLPYDSLARLAAERQQLDHLLGTAPQQTEAAQQQLGKALQAEAQQVMQELLAEMLPNLEAELQRRLNQRLQQLIEDFQKPKR